MFPSCKVCKSGLVPCDCNPIKLPEQDQMKQYQQRVIDEKIELDRKATDLSNFIGLSDEFDELGDNEQYLTREQCEIMWELSEILEARIALFNL